MATTRYRMTWTYHSERQGQPSGKGSPMRSSNFADGPLEGLKLIGFRYLGDAERKRRPEPERGRSRASYSRQWRTA